MAASEPTLRLIIAGTRTFTPSQPENAAALMEKIDQEVLKRLNATGTDISAHVELASGKAAGADKFGEAWAVSRKVAVRDFPAKWQTLGRRAGPIRNQEMADWAGSASASASGGLLIAIWDYISPGTNDMINKAKLAGLDVVVLPSSVYS